MINEKSNLSSIAAYDENYQPYSNIHEQNDKNNINKIL